MADTTKIADVLKGVLGDIYSLYLKTHGYHWNVEGPNFKPLHELFEENYRAMWESMDEVAERIRTLGVYAPMGGQALMDHARIDSSDNDVPSANTMVQNLIAGHETFVDNAKQGLGLLAEDPASEGLVVDLITAHEKNGLDAALQP